MNDLQDETPEAVMDAAVARHDLVGAVVCVAQDGQQVWQRSVGLADRDNARPMQEDTIFLLASVTKPVVAAAAMKLVEQNVLHLEDPVSRWLPSFRPELRDGSAPEITVRHLLTHMSGLSYRFSESQHSPYHALNVSDGLDQPGLSLEENLSRLVQAPLRFVPGTRWRYSLAMDVLGGVMSAATGEKLPKLVEDIILSPLNMIDTGFSVVDHKRLAVPYAGDGRNLVKISDGMTVTMGAEKVIFASSRLDNSASYPSGGAGMAGTAGDILRFLEAIRLFGRGILSKDTVAAMVAEQVPAGTRGLSAGKAFGYGWGIISDPEAAISPLSPGSLQWGGVYGHNWFIDPLRKLSCVILTNTTPEGMSGRFVQDMQKAICRSFEVRQDEF
ncbi:MAG: serine hydrolase domain-containing protein [Acetobacter sp.]